MIEVKYSVINWTHTVSKLFVKILNKDFKFGIESSVYFDGKYKGRIKGDITVDNISFKYEGTDNYIIKNYLFINFRRKMAMGVYLQKWGKNTKIKDNEQEIGKKCIF